MANIMRLGGGSGSGKGNILTVNAPAGSTVTATNGSETKTAVENNGVWVFKGLEAGTWTITATFTKRQRNLETACKKKEGRTTVLWTAI